MTPKANQEAITANGEYSLYPLIPGREVLIEWEVTAGSATVTPGLVSISGAFIPVKAVDGTDPVFDAAGGFFRVVIPSSGMAALKVESASVADPEADPPVLALSMKYSQTEIQ